MRLVVLASIAATLIGLNFLAWAAVERIDINDESARSVSSRLDRLPTDADIVFLGDSRTNQGLIPHVFEDAYFERTGKRVSAVNLGRSGMQSPFFFYTLQNYIAASSKPPDAVILNVSYYMLEEVGWLDRVYFHGFRATPAQTLDAVRHGLVSVGDAAAWYGRTRIPIWQFRNTFHNVVVPAIAGDMQTLADTVALQAQTEEALYGSQTRGYLFRTADHIGPEPPPLKSRFDRDQTAPLFLAYLARFFALAEAHGIEVVIYEFPWPEAHRSPGHEEIIRYHKDRVADVAAPYSNVRFVSYDPYMPHTHFADPLHLNGRGATILSSIASGWL